MKSKKKFKFIEIIKSDKKIRYFTIYSVLILFISVIGFSLSFYTRENYDNAVNFTINGLSYLINTNAGASDDRILELDVGKIEKFAVSIISKNTVDTKYELLYEVCADSSCSSVLSSLDENVKIGYDASLTNQLSGTIAKNETKSVNLVTQNDTSSNVYIRLILNAGYAWNDLALSNQIQSLNLSSKVINIDKYLYNDKTNIYPSDCSFTMTGVKAYNGSSLIPGTNSGINVSCSSDVWTSTFSGFPSKIEYYYENEYLLQNDTEKPKCSLSVSGTTINATYSDNVAVAYHGWNSSYSGPKSASKSITAVGTYTFYVKDYKENKNSCSLSVIPTHDESYTTTCTRNVKIKSCPTKCTCSSGWYTSSGWDGPGCYTTRDVECEETRKACLSGYSIINDSYCYKIN